MVAVNKPPGVAAHPSKGHETGTVVDWFALRYPGAAAQFDSDRPGLVHRLDADTSGVLMLGKTPAAQAFLAEQLRDKEAGKLYLAVVDGIPAEAKAVIDAPIARHPADRLRMAVVTRGRASRTAYEVLASGEGCALLSVRPETGRTHQIRVHLAAVGHAVTGDALYGQASGVIGRQALHAAGLTVRRPSDRKRLEIRAALAADVLRLLRNLGLDEAAGPYLRGGSQVLASS